MTTSHRPRTARTHLAPGVIALGALVTASAVACATDTTPSLPPLTAAAHDSAWRAWQGTRAKFLTTPGRPLSYSGLTWLRPGANSVGADSSNAVVLPGRGVPPVLGTLVRDGFRVRFEPARVAGSSAATIDSAPAVSTVALRTDADSGRPSRVEVGSAGFRVIRRVDSLGVRAWDAERPALKEFAGLTYFPRDASWRVPARFRPLAEPRRVAVMTEAGVPEYHAIVGTVRATIGDSTYDLTAFEGNGAADLLLVFTDRTSGDESYGFRFLHAPRDTVTDIVALDFNFAYNPDCAFTRFATCPLPPRENRVRVPIRAGERAFGDSRLASRE
jgi:uncharacterized protein